MATSSRQAPSKPFPSTYYKSKPLVFENSTPDPFPDSHLDYTDTVNIEQDNVTGLYNNPAIFSDKTTRLHLPKSHPTWGMLRLCLFLVPAFSIEFCRVFASMFLLVHVIICPEMKGLILIFGGFMGLGLTIYTSRVFKTSLSNLTRKRAMAFFCVYHALVFFGASLIAGSSWSSLFLEDDKAWLNASMPATSLNGNGTSLELSAYGDFEDNMPIPPLINRILTIIGYVILSSTTGSGQYLIVCLMAFAGKNQPRTSSTTVTVILTATGACTAGFVGAVDMASNWCPAHICPSHVNPQAAVLSSATLCLLPVGLVCSSLALSAENVVKACKRIFNRRWQNAEAWNPARRSTRTAQEIFDECASLLRDHETSFSSSQVADDSSFATEDSERLRPSYDAANNYSHNKNSNKRYPHQITTGLEEPKLRKLFKNKNFVGALIGMSLLTCLSLVFQFYSTPYLSQTIAVSNRTGLKVHPDQAEEIDWSQFEASRDVRNVYGLKVNGLAVLICNGVFIVLYLNRNSIADWIKLEWKIWVLPGCLAVLAILACVTGVISNIITFLLTACVIGFAKVLEAVILHTVVAQCIRTWPPVVLKPTDSPTVLLWSLTPTSLALSSAIITAMHKLTLLPAVPMFLVAVLASMAAVSFIVFKTKII